MKKIFILLVFIFNIYPLIHKGKVSVSSFQAVYAQDTDDDGEEDTTKVDLPTVKICADGHYSTVDDGSFTTITKCSTTIDCDTGTPVGQDEGEDPDTHCWTYSMEPDGDYDPGDITASTADETIITGGTTPNGYYTLDTSPLVTVITLNLTRDGALRFLGDMGDFTTHEGYWGAMFPQAGALIGGIEYINNLNWSNIQSTFVNSQAQGLIITEIIEVIPDPEGGSVTLNTYQVSLPDGTVIGTASL